MQAILMRQLTTSTTVMVASINNIKLIGMPSNNMWMPAAQLSKLKEMRSNPTYLTTSTTKNSTKNPKLLNQC
jgi:hypothetical protein